MRRGRLRHRVTLERPVEVVSNGEPVRTWQGVTTVWAGIEPMTGRELSLARQWSSRATHTLIMGRERDDLNATWRVRFGARTFNIVAVMEKDEAGHEVRCVVEEARA